MAEQELTKLLETALSLTQWFQKIGHKDFEALREADSTKRPRLGVLNRVIGLPYDNPVYFDAADVTLDNPKFKEVYDNRGDETCGFRLLPKSGYANLPIIRTRGQSIKDTFEWFKQQDFDRTKYQLELTPHNSDYNWSTIFVVNQHGIFGEIIQGGLYHLSHGHHGAAKPVTFSYDFVDWLFSDDKPDPKLVAHLEVLIAHIQVTDQAKQAELREVLSSKFSHDYLMGYFETIDTAAGTWFCDYSITIGDIFADLKPTISIGAKGLLSRGQTGASGEATGPVQIVTPEQIAAGAVEFNKGSVLVCRVTTPDFLPYMQDAAAIVTDQGGVLSHAAIVARELHVPCVVGAADATSVLRDGMRINVDADHAVVTPA